MYSVLESRSKAALMTLFDSMADYQQLALAAATQGSQASNKIPDSVDFARLRTRIDKYKERHQTCLENNHATMQAQYQQGQEKTKFYFEKHQQLKAKKSSKRQRDSSSGGSNPQKRKLSTSKSDGPVSKQPNTDSSAAKEEPGDPDEQLLIFNDIDKDFAKDFDGFDLMTILEEAQGNNARPATDCDKIEQKPPNGAYPNSMLHTPNNNNNSQPLQQPQSIPQPPSRHLSNTPSPQLHNGALAQQVMNQAYIPTSRQTASREQLSATPNPALYESVVKTERPSAGTTEPVPGIQLSRRSEATPVSLAMRQQLERQSSMPVEYTSRQYTAGAYPGVPTKALPSQMISRLPQGSPTVGASVPPEYARQMSAPVQPGSAPGSYYPQMLSNAREYPHGGHVAGYSGYPPGQYVQQGQPITPEEMHRMKMLQHKAQLAGSNALAGAAYADPRVGAASGYYPMSESSAAVMQHQASLRASSMMQQHPGQVAHSVSVPTPGPAQAQYGMQPRANYSMNMSEGVTQAPMMSRQMSHTQLSAHELQAKASNMQHHPAATTRQMSNTFPMTQQPTMVGGTPTYPTAHISMRTMSMGNPVMMPQQHQSTTVAQHHLSRPRSAGNSQQAISAQSHMMPASHASSMHPHPMHRPPSASGVHSGPAHPQQSQQVLPHTTSPPHPLGHPQGHSQGHPQGLAHGHPQGLPQGLPHGHPHGHPQAHPQTHPQAHSQYLSMQQKQAQQQLHTHQRAMPTMSHQSQHPMHMQHSVPLQSQGTCSAPSQQPQTQRSQAVSPEQQHPVHTQQLQEDLTDLELILSGAGT